jgi:hypothetical protein
MLNELLSFYTLYPFNLNTYEQINTLIISKNTNIKIENIDKDSVVHTEISSKVPIFIKFYKNIVYVWSTVSNHDTKEEAYHGDYQYEDFEGHINSPVVFMYHIWYLLEITNLNIIIKGDNNEMTINIPYTLVNEGNNIVN